MKQPVLLFTFFLFGMISYCQSYDDLGKLYSKGEKDKVIQLGLEYLKRDSTNTQLNSLVGRAYADLGKYKEAKPYLEKGVVVENSKVWIQAWSLAYLGICQYMNGEYEDAKIALQSSLKLNATPNVTAFAKKQMENLMLDDYFDNWHIIETKHIRFHIQDTNDVKNVKKYIQLREQAYLKNNVFFNAEPFKLIDFFVWSSRERMKERLSVEWGFAVSKVCMIHACYDQTTGHEITHILCDFGINPVAKSRLINEGISVYFDQTSRNKMEVARKELKGAKVSVVDLWNSPEKFLESYYYSIGGAFIDFLISNGTQEQLKKLLSDQTVNNAKLIYGNFDELVKVFENELSKTN